MQTPWKALILGGALMLASPAGAQPAAAPAPGGGGEPVMELRPDPAAGPAADAPTGPAAQSGSLTPAGETAAPPRGPRRPQLVGKPSGFWTSPVPSRGGAYRYRMLGIGIALAALTGLITMRVLRRHGGRVPDADRPFAKRPTA